MKRICSVSLLLILVSWTFADERPIISEAVIPASLDDVWHAWTTNAGLQAWLAPHVEIDLKIGGKMRSNYDPKGKLGDAKTIENTILCFDPKRMLSIRATKPPEGFPFVNAIKNCWTVIYFEKAGPASTKLTVSMLGYTSDEESQKMRKHFEWGNDFTLKKLQKHFEAKKAAR